MDGLLTVNKLKNLLVCNFLFREELENYSIDYIEEKYYRIFF